MGGALKGLGAALGGAVGGIGGGPREAEKAAQVQMAATDAQQAQTIMTQIAADAQKQQAERWKIMRDAQTKIFEITQDVTINKCKVASKCVDLFSGYLRA